ncbi:hypothetical protein ABT160_46355 [Streptomyces sp. NPDC001941]|uniref:hypothetical protein n=1 Tax=Streptomyces sp. NPDC001941 TaxID=3154659 RepID=UPI00331DE231
MDAATPKPRPDYPPRTPPPPKKPVEPPRPEPDTRPLPTPPDPRTQVARRRVAAVIRNRRAANWTLENAPWTPAKTGRLVVEQLIAWSYPLRETERQRWVEVSQLLGEAALADGGRRVSVHLADQDETALVMVLSHHSTQAPQDQARKGEESVLRSLTGLGVLSCGVEHAAGEPGTRRFAVLALPRRDAAPVPISVEG